MIVQEFLKLTLTDGTPLWVVIARDVMIPAFTFGGGVFAFCAWYSRKRKEHKLMHQTKAYEILLEKELECYKELTPIIDDIYEPSTAIIIEYHKLMKGEENTYQAAISNFDLKTDRFLCFIKKNPIYMDDSVNEACSKLAKEILMFWSRQMTVPQYQTTDVISEHVENKLSDRYDALIKCASNLNNQIKLHLKKLSKI